MNHRFAAAGMSIAGAFMLHSLFVLVVEAFRLSPDGHRKYAEIEVV